MYGISSLLGLIATCQNKVGMASRQLPEIADRLRTFTPLEATFSVIFVAILCNSMTVTAFYWGLSSYQAGYRMILSTFVMDSLDTSHDCSRYNAGYRITSTTI